MFAVTLTGVPKIDLLPAAGGLARECRRAEQRAGARCTPCPTCVPVLPRALVETQAGDEAVGVGAELHAELHRAEVAGVDRRRAS